MKKLPLFGVSVLAVVAFSAIAVASSAMGDVTVWLVNGVEPTSKVLVTSETMGTLVMQDMSNTTPAQMNCLNVKNEGWVGPGSEGETTSVNFGQAECGLNGKAENLKGEQVANACTALDKIEVVNLPWKSLIELINNVTYVLILPGVSGLEPGYKIECVTGLGLVADTCITTAGNEVNVEGSNDTPGGNVLFEFLKTPLHESEATKCSIGGAEEGLVVGGDTLITVPGGTLQFSSH